MSNLTFTTVLTLYFFWLSAIASLNLYRGYLTGQLTWRMPVFYLALPTMAGFILLDWIMNRTVFMLVCWDLPADWRELVTTRMIRYKASTSPNTYRLWVAVQICGLLNLFNFDSNTHC
jgi:hypothetical protein